MHARRCARALRRWALVCISVVLMAGCAIAPLSTPSGAPSGTAGAAGVAGAASALTGGFTLEGRISVNYGTQNVSGKVQWMHDAARDDIALASPLGTQVARLVRDATGVALTDSEQATHRARDAETLTQQRLGWRLPLTGLADWVRGRTHGSAPDELRRDERGRIAFLAEEGWGIDYAYPDDSSGNGSGAAAVLPRRLFLRYVRAAEPLEIRLVIDQWGMP